MIPPADASALRFARDLVAFESTSCLTNLPVSDYAQHVLDRLGFEIERLEYTDPAGVRKASLVARRGPASAPTSGNAGPQHGLAYFAHTDVVPANPWLFKDHGPFAPTVKDNRLYGRGACDMKGSIACFLAAAAHVDPARQLRPLYITLTADEEVGFNGAADVARRSRFYAEMVAGEAHGIIGEPTRLEVVYAHKGVYGFTAISHGRAAHSSTSDGLNANLAMIPFLVEMKNIHDELQHDPAWHNAEFNPPTVSWNIGVNDHTPAVNITAPQSICTVYFRPMPGQDAELLMNRARDAAARCSLEFKPAWYGSPLYTDPKSPFIADLLRLTGRTTPRTVSYGTDGSMFSAMKHLAVLGPGDLAQAHTHDEWIALEQLDSGVALYRRLIDHFCCG